MKFDPHAGRVVASASADGTVIVSSCYIPEVDKDSNGLFGNYKETEPTILFKFKMREWANTLSFSPSGEALMFSSKYSHKFFVTLFSPAHDSIMHYYEIG